jgi:hypothetical protein
MDASTKNINAVISSLHLDVLTREDKLEQAINSAGDLEYKILEIKGYLKDLVLAEHMLAKFQSLITANTKSE